MVPVQLEMALAALGWGTRDLSREAGVSLDTIARFKRGETLRPSTAQTIRSALEGAGVVFVEPNGMGPGVRLKEPGE